MFNNFKFFSSDKLAGLSAFLFLAGTKLALVAYAGNATPFWDEWDAQGAFLIKPLMEHRLGLTELLKPQNEHLVLFTKLLTLVLLYASGYWDVILQMIVNALLYASIASVFLTKLAEGMSLPNRIGLIAGGALILALPAGWDNGLLGFNTHFYLLIGFSLASLWFCVGEAVWSPRWLLGVCFAMASVLNMASGVLTFATIVAMTSLQIIFRKRPGLMREWLGIGALAITAAALALAVPRLPGHEVLRAHSAKEFFWAFRQLAAWPAESARGLFLNIPALALTIHLFRERQKSSEPGWFNIAVSCWVAGQIVALAAGRAQAPMASRYLDVLQIGVVANLAAALRLAENCLSATVNIRRFAFAALLCWSAAVTVWTGANAIPKMRDGIEERRRTAETETSNLRAYLSTNDASYLTNKPPLDIPYPVADRLRELLDDSSIRSTLPTNLTGKTAPYAAIERLKSALLRLPNAFLFVSLLLLAAAMRQCRSAPDPAPCDTLATSSNRTAEPSD